MPSNHTSGFWTIFNQYGLSKNAALQNSSSPIEGQQQWLAQQRQKREGICQDAALLNKYSNGTALMDEEKKRVQQLQKNTQQRKHRRKDSALLNKYYADDLPVMEEEEKRVRQLDTARNTKN